MIKLPDLTTPLIIGALATASYLYVASLQDTIKEQKTKISNLQEDLKVQKANAKVNCFEKSLEQKKIQLEKGQTDEKVNFTIDANNTITF